MEKYIINGVEVEYDTFDLDNMERLADSVQALQDDVKDIQGRMKDGGDTFKLLREQANLMLDFFDDVLGDGAAKKIFGSRINILDIANGYKEFTSAVAKQQAALAEVVAQPNREQRRARDRK